MTASKLPLAKDIAGFEFAGTPINESLVGDLAVGAFIATQRDVVLVCGTGSGKTHLSIATARSCIRGGARVRSYNTTNLVNRLELEARLDRTGKLAELQDVSVLHRTLHAVSLLHLMDRGLLAT